MSLTTIQVLVIQNFLVINQWNNLMITMISSCFSLKVLFIDKPINSYLIGSNTQVPLHKLKDVIPQSIHMIS